MEVIKGNGYETLPPNYTGLHLIDDIYFEYVVDGKMVSFGWWKESDYLAILKNEYPEAYETLIGAILSGKQ